MKICVLEQHKELCKKNAKVERMIGGEWARTGVEHMVYNFDVHLQGICLNSPADGCQKQEKKWPYNEWVRASEKNEDISAFVFINFIVM